MTDWGRMVESELTSGEKNQVSKNAVHVLLDPSLLLDRKSFEWTLKLLRLRATWNGIVFFVPARLLEVMDDTRSAVQLSRFFAVRSEPTPVGELARGVEERGLSLFRGESFPPFLSDEPPSISLRVPVRSRVLAEVLLDEWAFLQSRSWIVSRTKKTFTKFVKAGSVALEVGQRCLDAAVRKTLKTSNSNELITTAQRLRALAKWLAVGGASATAVMQAPVAAILGAAAGYFLLFDPEVKLGFNTQNSKPLDGEGQE